MDPALQLHHTAQVVVVEAVASELVFALFQHHRQIALQALLIAKNFQRFALQNPGRIGLVGVFIADHGIAHQAHIGPIAVGQGFVGRGLRDAGR